MNSNKERYIESLKNCSEVAKKEYVFAQKKIENVIGRLGRIKTDILSINENDEHGGTHVSESHDRLTNLSKQIDSAITNSLDLTLKALQNKKQRLSSFSVTLFGRTMAGKSTIREAITQGDGGTIGKGAQRTTREIREYDWNHLRIIDTPGIGAFQGDEDREVALSIIDESDLVVFMASSDGIQEESFRGMKSLRSQNKPMVIVLNVKRDLTKAVFMRRFLKDPSVVFDDKTLRGHFSRIRKLAIDELGLKDVIIIPIHAQAAFLATRPDYKDISEELHRASRIDQMLSVLEREVRERGPVRRLQTILDGTVIQVSDTAEMLFEQSKLIEDKATFLKDKFAELDVWLDNHIKTVNESVAGEVNVLLKPLRSSISSFIEENIERKDVGDRWQKKVESLGVNDWVGRYQNRLIDEIKGRLQEFNSEMQFESEFRQNFECGGPDQFDPWDVKRSLRWASAGGAALAGVAAVALLITETNFWNPVGWVAGAVSIVALGLSWFFDDREKKVQRQKAKAAQQLRDQVDKMERRVVAQIKSWFYKSITRRLVFGIRKDTRSLYNGMFRISKMLKSASVECAKTVSAINLRLISRCGQLLSVDEESKVIDRVVRDPGLRTKILFKERVKSKRFCQVIGKALGEWVDGIQPGTINEMISETLLPAIVEPQKVSLEGDSATVYVQKRDIGKAIGKSGQNVSLASRLLGVRIYIKELIQEG